jgi:3-oxoacyl-(acyl-carrier-protein) synthase
MLNKGRLISFPYQTEVNQEKKAPKNILINAVGFGGNAVSIIIQKTY